MEEKKINILYVDDEPHNLSALKANLRHDYNMYTAESAEEGMEILKEADIHVIITDQRMPGTTGVQFLEAVCKVYPDPIRMVLTAWADNKAAIDAINLGHVYQYLLKPCEMADIRIAIENAFELYTLRAQNKKLLRDLLDVNQQLEFMLRQRLLSEDANPDAN